MGTLRGGLSMARSMLLAAVLAMMSITSRAAGHTWALLVAGSRGWENYRHQADVCGAYQSLLRAGVSRDRIITMMYDDVANSRVNPSPGILVNVLGGEDVYAGVRIDYAGTNVTSSHL